MILHYHLLLHILLLFKNTHLHIRGLSGIGDSSSCPSKPCQGLFLAQQTQCFPDVSVERQIFLGTSTHFCTKPRGLESLYPSLVDFWLQQAGWRRRDKRKTHHSLGGRDFTADYPAIHWRHVCSISSAPILRSCAYLETPDNCMSA